MGTVAERQTKGREAVCTHPALWRMWAPGELSQGAGAISGGRLSV